MRTLENHPLDVATAYSRPVSLLCLRVFACALMTILVSKN